MVTSTVTHVLLDFFGTLVNYSASRTEQGYHSTHLLLLSMGSSAIDYEEFLELWTAEADRFDERSAVDNREFSMNEVTAAFLTHALHREPRTEEVTAFTESYLREWNSGVVYIPQAIRVVKTLASHFHLAIVTNTHDPKLVPDHLTCMGIADCFQAVVTSLDVGWKKPHPAIYSAACTQLEIPPEEALFVGDSYVPDYIGPISFGIDAFLIDPDEEFSIPSCKRLRSLSELPERLGIRQPASSDGPGC